VQKKANDSKKKTVTNVNKDKDKKKKGKGKPASTIKLGGLQADWDEDG
jgi:hypothetical protein